MKNIYYKYLNNKYVIVIMACVGILCIILSYTFSDRKEISDNVFSEYEYIKQLETRTAELVSSIDGAGECVVMINYDTSVESVYVTENKKSYDNNQTENRGESEDNVLTMTDGNGNQSALIKKKIMPKISGVTVVCDGGNNKSVQTNVINAVSILLDIGSNKVCVIAKAN